MNLSLRCGVTAVVTLAALSCSDPVPPAAEGAFIVRLSSGVDGKQCASGASATYDVPAIHDISPQEELTDQKYLHRIIDGESGSQVSCTVKGGSAAFSGRIVQSPRVLEISDGMLTSNTTGTARISTVDTSKLSTTLTSAAADCTISVVSLGDETQVAPGSLWATFSCAAVLHAPNEGCAAKGTFLLDNCGK